MPIGYFKAIPRVSIKFERDSYKPGDELRARVTVHTDHPGMSVRRAVADLVFENRYTSTSIVSAVDARAFGNPGPQMTHFAREPRVARFDRRFTEERVDRTIIGQERLFTDGVIRHRTEIFDLRFQIKAPPAIRTTERRWSYRLSVHFDLPRMRDVEIHRAVPVVFD